MAKWFHSTLFDHGLDHVRAQIEAGNTVKAHVIKTFAAPGVYATVMADSLGATTLTQPDLTLGNDGTGRKVDVAPLDISATANSGGTPDLHIAIVDETAGTVLVVTDESTDQVVEIGNLLSVPSWSFSMAQPT